jgi:uncharacterized protein (DUF2336 family)
VRVAFAAQNAELLSLARSREPKARERLLEAIVSLCSSAAEVAGQPGVQPILGSILQSLVKDAEHDIRLRLARQLACADWAPPELIRLLAADEIEIAAPVIADSPLLEDRDLLQLLVEATIDHQIAVARRPRISGTIVEAILKADEASVLCALADNQTADLSPAALASLVEKSRRQALLRAPLGRHPRLSSDLALRLYLWVGQSVRGALAERFDLGPDQLDRALAEAVQSAHAGAEPLSDSPDESLDQRRFQEQQLVEKLHLAGQLRPGFLMRMLREGRLGVFENALAALGQFDRIQVHKALNSEKPELLALACAAVGIDRSVFPDILQAVRQLNDGRPGGGDQGLRRAAGAFGPFDPDIAAMAFRQAITTV